MKDRTQDILDELLVIQAQGGDIASFNMLVERWQRKMLNHAYRFLKNTTISKDIVQESWHAVVKGLPRLKDPSVFKYWILRIVSNKSINWLRQNKHIEGINESSLPVDTSTDNYDELLDLLRQALRQLPRQSAMILHLHYFNEFSIDEISQILAIPSGTVKSRLFHARSKLKILLVRKINPKNHENKEKIYR